MTGVQTCALPIYSHIKRIAAEKPRTIVQLADVIDMAFATRHGESLLAVVESVNPR